MKRIVLFAALLIAVSNQAKAQPFSMTTAIDSFTTNSSEITFFVKLWDGGPNYTSGSTLWNEGNMRYDLFVSGSAVLNFAGATVSNINSTYMDVVTVAYYPVGLGAAPPNYRFQIFIGRGSKPDLPTAETRMFRITVPILAGSINTTSSTLTLRTSPTGVTGSNWSNAAVAGNSFDAINNNVPLGVELLTFTATATPERTAKLEWQTATEKNSSHFIVERSADGQRFTDQVARMQAAGTSNDLLTYHNFDFKPLTGNNYYRLKMVDKDGSFKYSETRRLVFEAPIADVTAIPNPFQSATSIRVQADQDQMANYYLMDAAGRAIRTGVWEVKKGVQEFPMPLEDAATGNYILTVQGSTILAELKLLKSN